MPTPKSPNQPVPSQPNPSEPGPSSYPQRTSNPEVELPTHRPSTDEPDASLKQNEGEGSWSAARRYNAGVQASVQKQQADQQQQTNKQQGKNDSNLPGVARIYKDGQWATSPGPQQTSGIDQHDSQRQSLRTDQQGGEPNYDDGSMISSRSPNQGYKRYDVTPDSIH